MRRIALARKRLRRDEEGAEFAAAIFVLPILFVLLIGIIDVGWMIKTRMQIENIVSGMAKQAAADGGNYNPIAMPAGARPWDQVLAGELWNGRTCPQSNCSGPPTNVSCQTIETPAGDRYQSNTAWNAGDVINCSVTYQYEALSGGLLHTPLGLGIGSLLDPFTVTQSARSEIGQSGY